MADFVESVRNGWLDDFGSATTYLALFDGDPQGAGSELSGGGYARVAIATGDWNAASGGIKTNGTAKSFPQATADWNGGSAITHFAIMSASSGGSVMASEVLSTSKIILNTDTAEFGVGALSLSVS